MGKAEFDKAAEIYEKILLRSESEAEAYWGLILCKYGIEYVEDPVTYNRIPTCHRASYDAVITDEDYKNALKYADPVQREIYESEAKVIDEIQKGILALAQKEEAYDVFICYKETDDNGKRTPDSVIANDIYHQLTMEGYKVFYAAISLEDKLGKEYEPYIFSALNTAKVMLAIGTRPEYFNAVWVKNEWSRFLKLIQKDRSRLLIPCFRDMDPYELPEEFAHLQAQDMSKIGFINDIVRGIKKVIVKESVNLTKEESSIVQSDGNSNIDALLKRGMMSLEDCEWTRADDFFEQVLNIDPECPQAYWGKLLLGSRVNNAIKYGEKLFDIILNKKTKKETALTINLVEIAREIDKADETLSFFTDNELERVLAQEFNPTKYKYIDCVLYLEKEKKKLASSHDISAYVNTGLYSRVLQFADSDVKSSIDLVFQRMYISKSVRLTANRSISLKR